MSLTEVIILALCAAIIAGVWGVFMKAGEKGWKALIPFYNFYVLLRISGCSRWWVIVCIVPFVSPYLSERGILMESGMGMEGIVVAFLDAMIILAINLSILVVFARVSHYLAEKFSKEFWFTAGLVFLPFIFWPLLGFDGSEYQDQ